MAKSPDTIRVTNDALAKQLEDEGKRLIEFAMSLRQGFDVPVTYGAAGHEHDFHSVQFAWGVATGSAGAATVLTSVNGLSGCMPGRCPAMSDAEKALSLEELRMTPTERTMFEAGRASRDQEVAEPERQIDSWIKSATEAKDEHRTAVAELRAENEAIKTVDGEELRVRDGRIAVLEAVIEKVREALTNDRVIMVKREHGYSVEDYSNPLVPVKAIEALLAAVPSGVLAERDANKWDEGAKTGWGQGISRPLYSVLQLNPHRKGTHHE